MKPPQLDVTDLKGAILTLEKLEATPKGKVNILTEQRNNRYLFQIFYMSLGQDVYHLTIKEDVPSLKPWDLATAWEQFCLLVQTLNTRSVTGQKAIDKATTVLGHCPDRARKWFTRILNRDLRVGVGRALVEEAFGRSVLQDTTAPATKWFYHGCMCAKPFHKAVTSKKPLIFPVAAEPKLDGERAQLFWVPTEDKVYCFSRKGKPKTEIQQTEAFVTQVKSFAKRLHILAQLQEQDGIYLDGEFLSSDWNSTASVVSRTKNFDADDFLSKVRTILWDWSSLSSYQEGEFRLAWKERKALLMKTAGLQSTTGSLTKVTDNIWVAGHVVVQNQRALDDLYAKSLDLNFEGIMIKKLDAPHVFHRKHEYIVKLKPDEDKTGTILEVLPGEGANAAASEQDKTAVQLAMSEKGAVTDDGAYLCLEAGVRAQVALEELQKIVSDSVDHRLSCHDGVVRYRYSARMGRLLIESGNQQFMVGTGFRHKAGQDDRTDFWLRRQELVGMKLDFKAQAGKTATVVARHSRFVRLREDL